MRLTKVARFREQTKIQAAKKLSAAQDALVAAEQQLKQIRELGTSYVTQVGASSSASQLQLRSMFIQQLEASLRLQEQHAARLREYLNQCQLEYRDSRADEKLLAGLIAKRDADHTRSAFKKQERGQIYRSKAKL